MLLGSSDINGHVQRKWNQSVGNLMPCLYLPQCYSVYGGTTKHHIMSTQRDKQGHFTDKHWVSLMLK